MARLNAAEQGFFAAGDVPLIGLFTALTRWWEDRHLELLATAGFDDLRRAHNSIVVNLPAKGLRLTEIAARAGVSKQAAAELVDDLVQKGYLTRTADPTDGRAKIIKWAERGQAAHAATIEAFTKIESEIATVLDRGGLDSLKDALRQLLSTLVLSKPDRQS